MTASEPAGERIEEVFELFHAALEVPEDEREAWLARRCGDDHALRREVAELVAAHDDDDDALDRSADALKECADEVLDEGLPPTDRIGPYRIVRAVATGGMGTVFEAEQEHPHRRVALKVLRFGIESESALRRFEYESQILARLRHPGVAHVYDSGTYERADGRRAPWFAMEYVEGGRPITDHARRARLSVEARLRLVAAVCDAVHHGHQKGVIHRDLKPANVLVDDAGRVKVIDFGVAKATDADLGSIALETRAGQLVGTLAYMSPEQASGDGDEIDVRSDVYSLGVILYELLTGRLPHDVRGLGLMTAVRRIGERDAARGPLDAGALPDDVKTLVLKALARGREERYASAAAFARDVHRFLRCEPIAARPPSALYHLRTFVRRNRLLAGSVAGLFVALLLGGGAALWGYVAVERKNAVVEWQNAFLIGLLAEADPWQGEGPQATVGEAVTRAAERLDADPPPPSTEVGLRHRLGEILLRVGEPAMAAKHLERAAALDRELGRADTADSLGARLRWLHALIDAGAIDEAERRTEELIEHATRALGRDHRYTVGARVTEGQILAERGRFEEARERFEAGVRWRREHLGPGDLATAQAENNLAAALVELGREDEAAELFAHVVRIRTLALGEDHPQVLLARQNLAATFARSGKVAAAADVTREIWESQRARLGEDHPATLGTLSNLAMLYRVIGRLDEAEPLSRRAYALRRARLGDDDPDTLRSGCNLAVLLVARCARGRKGKGDVLSPAGAEAEALFLDLLRTVRRSERATPQNEAQLLSSYGNLLLLQGRPAEADVVYARAEAVAARAWGEGRTETWTTRVGAGAAALLRGRREEAEAKIREAAAWLRERLGGEAEAVRNAEFWVRQLERGGKVEAEP